MAKSSAKKRLNEAYEKLADDPSQTEAEFYCAAQSEVLESTVEAPEHANEVTVNSLDEEYQEGYRAIPEEITKIEALLPYLAVESDEFL